MDNSLELTQTVFCVTCGDTLAVWEVNVCLLCEVDGE